ncbi:hypothetical protein B296_00040984 [Ensete ventricosum]|uniref:Pectinesterase inhibitor domain-containing protein n=1 Tax=Ensete ventricosum TaxID=4639 RepID=A0A426XXD8_ENSVE|nr:hypothetical protein B296_00040984 [Ensete ventricosum]
MSNVETWVSAALTSQDTCLDGFAGLQGKEAVVSPPSSSPPLPRSPTPFSVRSTLLHRLVPRRPPPPRPRGPLRRLALPPPRLPLRLRDFGRSLAGSDRTGPCSARFPVASVADLRAGLGRRGSGLVARGWRRSCVRPLGVMLRDKVKGVAVRKTIETPEEVKRLPLTGRVRVREKQSVTHKQTLGLFPRLTQAASLSEDLTGLPRSLRRPPGSTAATPSLASSSSLLSCVSVSGPPRTRYSVIATTEMIIPTVRRPRILDFLKPYVLKMHITDKYVSAQVVHTPTAEVAVSASSHERLLRPSIGSTRDVAAAAKIGKLLGERLLLRGIPAVCVFLKKEQKYHGKVKAVIDSVRDAGRRRGMGLLDQLWDDTIAGPRPETGLGRLRKQSSSGLCSNSSKGVLRSDDAASDPTVSMAAMWWWSRGSGEGRSNRPIGGHRRRGGREADTEHHDQASGWVLITCECHASGVACRIHAANLALFR